MLYSRLRTRLKARLQANDGAASRIVLAFSGGLDSRVLLHLLGRFQTEHPDVVCLAVHVHHGLSRHADDWAQQCLNWADDAGIACRIERVTLHLGNRLSLEQQAREARYQALAHHLRPGDLLLTAQHADDQLETVLLALKRGSGPAGLAAMPDEMAFADGIHLRPLLDCPRDELAAYAYRHGLEWVEDESNQDERFDRNFLRHQIAPKLAERWPGIRKAVARSAALCGEQEALLQELLADKLNAALAPDHSLCVAGLGSALQGKALIRQWLAGQKVRMPSKAQLDQIWESVVQAREDANPCLKTEGYEVRRFQQRLYRVASWPELTDSRIPCSLGTPCQLPQDLGSLTLSPAANGCLRLPRADEPVSIRFEPAGLHVQPLGRVGKRKLKKLFQEYGVPSWNRRRTPLVFYGEELAAVAGLFVVSGFEGRECDLKWHN